MVARSFFLSLALVACLVGSVQMQDGSMGPMQPSGQGGLGGMLGGLLGGQQQQGMGGGQMPQYGQSMMNGGQRQGNDLLNSLPRQLTEMIQRLMSQLRQTLSQQQQNQMGGMGQNGMGMGMGTMMNQYGQPNSMQYSQQQPQGLLSSLGALGGSQGGPLGRLTSGLNLNGLTSVANPLTNSLSQQTGLPLNSLTQSLQSTLSNVMPTNLG